MSFERIRDTDPEKTVIDHKFICDAKGCSFSECNGQQYPNLPQGWARFEIKTKLRHELIEAGGDLCPRDLEKISQLLVCEDGWRGLASREVVENPFPVRVPLIEDPRAVVDPMPARLREGPYRRCALCGGGGPYVSSEEVLTRSQGAYARTSVCKWCEASVAVGARPRDVTLYLAGPL